MLEVTSTRHNPLIDPHLSVWSWEIPLYLFVGGIVAGMMVLAGLAMRRIAKGEDAAPFFSMQTPLLGFVLMNIGMLALLLDLTHRLYVWRIFTTFQVTLADGLGLVGADHRLRRAAGLGADPAARRLALAGPHRAGDQAPVRRARRAAVVDRARWAGPTSCWASAWASTPASCSTPWWRARCGTAPSSAPCSCSRAFRPAPR